MPISARLGSFISALCINRTLIPLFFKPCIERGFGLVGGVLRGVTRELEAVHMQDFLLSFV